VKGRKKRNDFFRSARETASCHRVCGKLDDAVECRRAWHGMRYDRVDLQGAALTQERVNGLVQFANEIRARFDSTDHDFAKRR